MLQNIVERDVSDLCGGAEDDRACGARPLSRGGKKCAQHARNWKFEI